MHYDHASYAVQGYILAMGELRGIIAVTAVIVAGTMAMRAQDMDRSLMEAAGVSDVEELDEETVEGFSQYRISPIRINGASRGTMISSGLFSPYEAASVLDYRSRYGDILSVSELSLVDGFGAKRARALAPFLSFASKSAPGALPDTLRSRCSFAARAGVSRGKGMSYSLKCRYLLEERLSAAVSCRSGFGDRLFPPSGYSFHFCLYGRRALESLIVGDYNARFGEGLLAWSGSFMTALSGSDSFSRRPSGLTPSWSWSSAEVHRGVAATFRLGQRVTVSAFGGFPGLRGVMEGRKGKVGVDGGVNASWYGSRHHLSLTAVGGTAGKEAMGLSGSFKWTPGRPVFFAEAAARPVKGAFSFIAGSIIPFGEGWRAAVRVGAVPTAYSGKKNGNYSLAGCVEYSTWKGVKSVLTGELGLLPVPGKDPRRKDLKIVWTSRFPIGERYSLELRLRHRLAPGSDGKRTEARLDQDYSVSNWKARLRAHAVYGGGWGGLTYLEAGYDNSSLKVFARLSGCYTSSWQSRIYCYERDAPGNFSVMVFHGRGVAFFILAGYSRKWKGHSLGVWFRPYYEKTDSRTGAGVRLQFSLEI